MNQAEAAKVLGLSQSQVSRLVSGRRGPSPNVMVKIERHFRWPMDAQISAMRDGHWWALFSERIDRVVYKEAA